MTRVVTYLFIGAISSSLGKLIDDPAKTLGSAAAAGTIRERSLAYSLACSTAAVSSR